MFVFFGPVAVLGTVLTQSGPPSALALVGAVGVGLLTCAVLVANNLRDIPTDEAVGKRTLAVMLGDRDTRRLYAALVLIPFLLTALAGLRSWPMLLGLLALPAAVVPVRRGARGRRRPGADPGAGPDRAPTAGLVDPRRRRAVVRAASSDAGFSLMRCGLSRSCSRGRPPAAAHGGPRARRSAAA